MAQQKLPYRPDRAEAIIKAKEVLERPQKTKFRVTVLFEKVDPDTGEVMQTKKFLHPALDDFHEAILILQQAVEAQDKGWLNATRSK